jgi:hypothetical protein
MYMTEMIYQQEARPVLMRFLNISAMLFRIAFFYLRGALSYAPDL